MLDAASLGVVCVKLRKASEMKLIMDNLNEDLVLTTDLLLGEKLLDEGKQLGLIGKEVVDSLAQLEQNIKENHRLDSQGRYEPAIDVSFLNMSNMKDSCKQLKKQMQQQDEEKRRQEQSELQAELDEEDLRESQELLREVGELSYKVPRRVWSSPAPEEASPKAVNATEELEMNQSEERITRYMTAEPDERGIVKVYIEDPHVIQAPKDSISVSFSMKSYTVRLRSKPPRVLGPVDCGVIDPERSSWRLTQGKRLTLSLELSEAGKINQQSKKRWDQLEAKMKAEKENGVPAKSAAPKAEPAEPEGKTLEQVMEETKLDRWMVRALMVFLLALTVGTILRRGM